MIEHGIILVAGLGSRLKPLTDHAPKCLTEVNGKPILVSTLENLADIGIKYCTIVTGYLRGVVENLIGSRYQSIEVQYKQNDIYDKTNDMYSLWLAQDIMEEGAVVLEGDIFFRVKILKNALKSMGEKSHYLAGKYNSKPNEILIKTNSSFKIQSIEVLRDKRGVKGDLNFMSSGMLVIQKDYGKQLSQWLGEFVEKNRVDILFDDVISEHIKCMPLYIYEIGHEEWVEIDTQEDLIRAETIFRPIHPL